MRMGSNSNEEATPIPIQIEIERVEEEEEETILYAASFDGEEGEEKFIRYETAQWVLYSVVLVVAWGLGLLMLLFLPLRIYISRKTLRSKRLFLTPNALVYKVSTPVCLPCFGHLKKQQHYLILPSVADVIVEQDYLQSFFGVYSLRIVYKGVRRPATDDVKIQGVALPTDFQKAVLTQLSSIRNEGSGKQASTSSALPLGDLILQKLDEVECSLKKVHALIGTKAHTSQTLH